jgi:hypothetical protein
MPDLLVAQRGLSPVRNPAARRLVPPAPPVDCQGLHEPLRLGLPHFQAWPHSQQPRLKRLPAARNCWPQWFLRQEQMALAHRLLSAGEILRIAPPKPELPPPFPLRQEAGLEVETETGAGAGAGAETAAKAED